MNYLLWRNEWDSRQHTGTPVPIRTVMTKILTAPDNSTLEILQHGKNIGFCRIIPNVSEGAATGQLMTDEFEPEGAVRKLSGYTLDIEGNATILSPTNRVNFSSNLSLSTNLNCHQWRLKISNGGNVWESESDFLTEHIGFNFKNQSDAWKGEVTFAELRQPEKLLFRLGVPWLIPLLPSLTAPLRSPAPSGSPGTNGIASFDPGLNWSAANDWTLVAHTRVRAYRIQVKLLDRYSAVAWISRVGEILRLELPNDIVLVNDALPGG
jgi:hypothetical protein